MLTVPTRPNPGVVRLILLGALAIGSSMVAITAEVRPAAADCGMQGPSRRIADYRGFAVEGVVRSVELLADEPGERRITLDVADTLAGPPVETVTFVGGEGDCTELQGERFKVGDRLILASTRPPIDDRVFDGWPLVWRYEWGDLWRMHGYQDRIVKMLPREARRARTRADILGLVAADRLPYALAPWAFEATIGRGSRHQRMRDVVAWGDGFVALGAVAPRWRENATRSTIHVSPDGRAWTRVPDPFPGVVGPSGSVDRLVVFRAELWAFGRDGLSLAAWRSADGQTWTRVDGGEVFVTTAAMSSDEPRYVYLNGAVVSGERLVVTGAPAEDAPQVQLSVWSTTDGTTWSAARATDELQQGWWPITAGREGLLSVGCCQSRGDRSQQSITSPDGVAWTAIGPLPDETQELRWDPTSASWLAAAIAVEPGAASHATLARSTDGVTWNPVIDGPLESTQWLSLGLGEGDLVLVGDRSGGGRPMWAMVSGDGGATWTLSDLPRTRGGDCLTRSAIGTQAIVIVGSCDRALAGTADR